MRRRIALVALAASACFSEPANPEVDSSADGSTHASTQPTTSATTMAGEADATTDVTVGSVGSTGSADTDGCADGMVRVPGPLPRGWSRWAIVAEGTPMMPAIACPQGEPDVVFAAADPQCSCECGDAADCNAQYATYGAGDCMISMGGGVIIGCTGLLNSVPGISVSDAKPPVSSCDAIASSRPGHDAVPISVCTFGPDDGCTTLPDGFVGPCLVGAASSTCPDGWVELAQPVAIECDTCPSCLLADACAARRYDFFTAGGCTGAHTTAAPDGSCVVGPIHSLQRAAPDPMAPTGCDDAQPILDEQRICCAPAG